MVFSAQPYDKWAFIQADQALAPKVERVEIQVERSRTFLELVVRLFRLIFELFANQTFWRHANAVALLLVYLV